MALPHFTRPDDIEQIVKYLFTKAKGATLNEVKAVLGPKIIDVRKQLAFKALNIIRQDADRIILTTEVGRPLGRANHEEFTRLLAGQLAGIPAYKGVLEWAYHNNISELEATEVGAHWHEHYTEDLGTEKEEEIASRAVCFLQLCSGAGLGQFIIGRRGQVSRLNISLPALEDFVKGENLLRPREETGDKEAVPKVEGEFQPGQKITPETKPTVVEKGNKVFISHGKNKKVAEQLKELLKFGKFEPIVSTERESTAVPVPDKVFDGMRQCSAALIHISSEGELLDPQGQKHIKINENVLIEIGAAIALYGKNFVLLVEKGISLPSNLQGLYRCEYEGNKLDYEATMKLLKIFNEFK